MHYFPVQNGELFAENIAVVDLVKQFGTPLYIYSRNAIESTWMQFNQAMGTQKHQICYAVKANSNLAILNLLARLGSGFDIVSGGELERVLTAGGDPEKIIFSGVGKLDWEIQRGIDIGIGCFNIESAQELLRIQQIAAKLQKKARIAIRINPHIDAFTHPYISTGLKENKFGIDSEEALPLFEQAAFLPNIEVIGIACHIGSQLTDLGPFLEAFDRLFNLWEVLKSRGIMLSQLDFGGGLGVNYISEQPPAIEMYVDALLNRLKQPQLKVIIEPGRSIIANAGILVTKVEYLKHTGHRNFAIVDAGMNDLLRPALYQAEQNIIPVQQRDKLAVSYDVVGPVCETSDFLGKDRALAIEPGDLLAVLTAGAYGFSMSSNYNTRPRAAEIMVDQDQVHIIRPREQIADLFNSERMLEL